MLRCWLISAVVVRWLVQKNSTVRPVTACMLLEFFM
jgi:hypothetical protein